MQADRFAGETATVRMIPIGMIRTLPQVRTAFKESSIKELAGDIQAHGVLQPLVVKRTQGGSGYDLIIGERRFRAIQYLGHPEVPAIIASIEDEKLEELQLIENIQREDLNVKDLSGAILALWKRHGSVVEVARRCNKSKSWVSKRLAIALDVGPLTAQLIDANAKDAELLYAFATLEKANEKAARELLPDLLEKRANRKDVQAALSEALGRKAQQGQKAIDDKQADLFQGEKPTTSGNPTQLEIALRALAEIAQLGTGSIAARAEQAIEEIRRMNHA